MKYNAKTEKDLLGLKDLSEEQITNILETAKTMKYIMSQKNKKRGIWWANQ